MLVFLALGNANVLSFALGDAKVPNANDFASQWNIGLRVHIWSARVCIGSARGCVGSPGYLDTNKFVQATQRIGPMCMGLHSNGI